MKKSISFMLCMVIFMLTFGSISYANEWKFDSITIPEEKREEFNNLLYNQDISRHLIEIDYLNGLKIIGLKIWDYPNNNVKINIIVLKDDKILKSESFSMCKGEFKKKYFDEKVSQLAFVEYGSRYAKAPTHSDFEGDSDIEKTYEHTKSIKDYTKYLRRYLKTLDIEVPEFKDYGKIERKGNKHKSNVAEGVSNIYNKDNTKIIAKITTNIADSKSL